MKTIKIIMRLGHIVYSVVRNRCPRCHRGKVFEDDNPYRLRFLFRMKKSCDHCQELYEKEPGYFFGAMFVSYALTSLAFFIVFMMDLLWFHLGISLLYFLLPAVVLISPVTFQWSRLIWLNFFIRYDKNLIDQPILPEPEK